MILIANEWKSLNPNVRALEERATVLHFNPAHDEIHRRAGEWFDDDVVFRFLESILAVTNPSRSSGLYDHEPYIEGIGRQIHAR